MDDQNKNLILATALSFRVILGWYSFFPPPEPEPAPETVANETAPAGDTAAAPGAAQPDTAVSTQPSEEAQAPDAPRLTIDTPRLAGSISLQGGRMDDLALKDYHVELAEDSDIVRVLSPVGEDNAFYALYGWAPGTGLGFDDVPGANTVWSAAEGQVLTPDSPVTLTLDNGKGLTFTRTVAVVEDYLISLPHSVQHLPP